MLWRVVLVVFAVVGVACSGADPGAEPAPDETEAETVPAAIALADSTPLATATTTTLAPLPERLVPLRQLWFEAGASLGLADCYTRVIDEAGFGDAADYEELSVAQASLEDADLAAFVDCGERFSVAPGN